MQKVLAIQYALRFQISSVYYTVKPVYSGQPMGITKVAFVRSVRKYLSDVQGAN